MENERKKNLAKLIGSIAACHGAGGIGAIFTAPQIATWYVDLVKPDFTPPNAVFMPVWLTLYTLMGVAIYLIWKKGLEAEGVKSAFIFFWVQLGINAIWSIVFFGQESILGGVIIIISLWVLLLITIIKFFRISKVAGGLLIPYITWISIASALNTSILVLNT